MGTQPLGSSTCCTAGSASPAACRTRSLKRHEEVVQGQHGRRTLAAVRHRTARAATRSCSATAFAQGVIHPRLPRTLRVHVRGHLGVGGAVGAVKEGLVVGEPARDDGVDHALRSQGTDVHRAR